MGGSKGKEERKRNFIYWLGPRASEHHLTSPGLLGQILFNNCKHYRGKSRDWLVYGADAETDTLAGF